MLRLLCLLGKHLWEYNLTYDPETHYRKCADCGKFQLGHYDMTYGETVYETSTPPHKE